MAKDTHKPTVDHYHYTKCKSSRGGAPIRMIVIHDTEGANAPGIKDLVGLGQYWDSTYNTPRASSSTSGVDLEGHSARYVRDADKPWTQAFYNPWSVSIENIGVSGFTQWSEEMYRENARWIAHWCHYHKIPPYKGRVTKDGIIVKEGVFRHIELGNLGGGHKDPPKDFDLGWVMQRARFYLKKY
jgi:hypothetical protein